MVSDDKRVRIITGNYGSGKTEFAVNYAVKLRQSAERKVVLADMDVVNVYFRPRDRRRELREMGVTVISSSIPERSNTDVPALSGGTEAAVRDGSCEVIIDLGGNSVGINALGRIKPLLDPEETEFFMVINANRPDTYDVRGILRQKEDLEESAGLKVTGFINNTNLIRQTALETMARGNEIIGEASRRANVPVRYVSYIEELISVPEGRFFGELFPMKLYMRQEWM